MNDKRRETGYKINYGRIHFLKINNFDALNFKIPRSLLQNEFIVERQNHFKWLQQIWVKMKAVLREKDVPASHRAGCNFLLTKIYMYLFSINMYCVYKNTHTIVLSSVTPYFLCF